MSIIEAIILGIVQGLTEFLPVSSSGHIEIGKVLLNIQTADNLLFSIIVHGATALSTVIVFRKTIFELLKGLLAFEMNESWKFALLILVSMIPVGIIGLLFEKQLEALFSGNLLLVGSMLIVTASLLALSYFRKPSNGDVGLKQAIIIGLAQSVAILPGISRSGATISTALMLGVDKDKATRFSFLMVLPPIIGATLLKVKDFIEEPAIADGISGIALTAGFIAAFLAGLFACSIMIKIVRSGKLIYFSIYCLLVGTVAIIAYLL
ncbi:MAG: undecaprenyl-diphosphate phosphatase [Cyclobacteriaceae bacterium]